MRAETVFQRKIDEITIHNTESEDVDYVRLVESISKSHEKRFGENKSCMGFDIGYHYLIFDDGSVVQTRCIDEIGYHNSKNNQTSLGVALVGNFNNEKPTQEQYDALNILLSILTKQFTGATVKPHRAWGSNCPGKYFDSNQIGEYLPGAKAVAKKPSDGSIGTFVLSRYYSPQEGQEAYFRGDLRAEVKMNCGINPKEPILSKNCIHTADGGALDNSMIGKVGACPEWLFKKTLIIDMGFGKQEFVCKDKGSAIVGGRLDIRAGYGNEGYNNIKNGVVHNTGKAKVRIKK